MTNEIVFKGEFNKKKTWFPTLLIVAAIIFPILALVFKFMNPLLAIAIAVVVLIIAIILLSIKPKNTLTITAKCIRIKKGKKFYWIPIDKITYLDMGKKSSVGIGTAQKIFRVKNLKNQQLVYASIARSIAVWQDKLFPTTPEFSLSAVLTPTGYSSERAIAPAFEATASTVEVSDVVPTPKTAEEKINYNKVLFEKGEITEAEKNARNYAILKEEFPDMY